jgi:hypothetical protein
MKRLSGCHLRGPSAYLWPRRCLSGSPTGGEEACDLVHERVAEAAKPLGRQVERGPALMRSRLGEFHAPTFRPRGATSNGHEAVLRGRRCRIRGSALALLDEFERASALRGLDPRPAAELGEQVAHVHVDRALAEEESRRDLPVRETVRREAEHLHLAP